MAKSKKQFKTEVQELLNLVIHSLYSNTDIFLRELISNASDAIDRLRFEALTNKGLVKGDPGWKIKLHRDEDERTLTISDNGIGMTREEVEKNIGTIARSGTRAFLEELKKANKKDSPELIGQFGVGFYSSFMVADKVTIITRKAGIKEGVKWHSKGDGNYTVEDCEKEERGTDIILHLVEDKKEYLEEWKIKQIVRQFSDFVEYPVAMDVTKEEIPKDEKGAPKEGAEKVITIEEQTLNSMQALWMRPKGKIKEDDYNEFYKHIAHDYTNPLKVVHYSAEGTVEFKALLYIPSKAPFDLFTREEYKGIHLYVKRVLIMDDCKDLIPEYLRFVKGVVESGDLPLNISREILQQNTIVQKIKSNLTGKILNTLKELKEKKPEDFIKFYKEFGRVIKEGVHFDHGNKEKLQELLMFESSKSDAGQLIYLKDYVNRMHEEQKEIYFITGENRETLSQSPHLEVFRSKDLEVLFMTDPIDEWVTQSLTEYNGKKLKAIDRGQVDLDFKEDKKKTDTKEKEVDKKFEHLLKHIKDKLGDNIKEVKLSSRLTDSISCLVIDEFAMSAQMERMFKAMNKDASAPPSQRILELNPKHPIMNVMLDLYKKDKGNDKLGGYIDLVYDLATLAEGAPVRNPVRLNRIVSDLMVFEGNTLTAKAQ